MKIALPLTQGRVSEHFGHCEQFALYTVVGDVIGAPSYLSPPAHEPGVFPSWLKKQGTDVVITGGMGRRAHDLFTQNNIEVISGVSSTEPDDLVAQYMDGTLESGTNKCSH
jgi:predicted Fe-Mo cluster-binding NifX family protein